MGDIRWQDGALRVRLLFDMAGVILGLHAGIPGNRLIGLVAAPSTAASIGTVRNTQSHGSRFGLIRLCM